MENEELNDAASNPLHEDHLPVSGEVDTEKEDINPDISDDMDLGGDKDIAV